MSPPPCAAAARRTRAAAAPPSSRAPLTLPTAHLRAGKYQPRTTFEDIDVLVEFGAASTACCSRSWCGRSRGEPDAYEIIAGERRWRAAQKAQLHEVPVVMRSLDDLDALQLALVENLQRADLSPIDEAQGYRRLIGDFNQTQEEVAQHHGQEPPACRQHAAAARPARGGARDDPPRRDLAPATAARCWPFPIPKRWPSAAIAEKLTVRDLEKLAAGERLKKASAAARQGGARSRGAKSADTARWRSASRKRWASRPRSTKAAARRPC